MTSIRQPDHHGCSVGDASGDVIYEEQPVVLTVSSFFCARLMIAARDEAPGEHDGTRMVSAGLCLETLQNIHI
jgi:hypothetical protein